MNIILIICILGQRWMESLPQEFSTWMIWVRVYTFINSSTGYILVQESLQHVFTIHLSSSLIVSWMLSVFRYCCTVIHKSVTINLIVHQQVGHILLGCSSQNNNDVFINTIIEIVQYDVAIVLRKIYSICIIAQ